MFGGGAQIVMVTVRMNRENRSPENHLDPTGILQTDAAAAASASTRFSWFSSLQSEFSSVSEVRPHRRVHGRRTSSTRTAPPHNNLDIFMVSLELTKTCSGPTTT